MATHVSSQFSDAYDNTLSASERRRFEAHCETCAACAEQFANYNASLNAVHALPKARMPRRVHIPATAPGHAQSSPWWQRLVAPRWATGVAVVAAVVLVVVAQRGQTVPSQNNAVSSGGNPKVQAPLGAAASPGGEKASTADTTSCGLLLVEMPTATPAQGFAHQTVVTDPTRPQQQLVLALADATSTTLSPGEAVNVYAVLSAPLAGVSRPGSAPLPAVAVHYSACVAWMGPTGSALTSPVSASHDVESIRVPAGIASGTKVTLVAQIPADVPQAGNAAITAALDITIAK